MSDQTEFSPEIEAMIDREAARDGAGCVKAARYLINRGMKTPEQAREWVRKQGLEGLSNDPRRLGIFMAAYDQDMRG